MPSSSPLSSAQLYFQPASRPWLRTLRLLNRHVRHWRHPFRHQELFPGFGFQLCRSRHTAIFVTGFCFQTLAPSYACLAVPYIQLVSVSSTAFCLVAVAADLYVMVVRATGPAQLHSGRFRKALISLFIVWLASIIYAARIFIDLLSPEAGGDFDLDVDDDDDKSYGHEEEEEEEECILFIETDVDDAAGRAVDLCLLYALPIAVQIFFYVKVAQKLWSSQVLQSYLFLHTTYTLNFGFKEIQEIENVL